MLTTAVQLAQLLGVTVVGSVYLSRAVPSGPGHPAAPAGAMSATACWLAGLSAVGLLTAAVMHRAVSGRPPRP